MEVVLESVVVVKEMMEGGGSVIMTALCDLTNIQGAAGRPRDYISVYFQINRNCCASKHPQHLE